MLDKNRSQLLLIDVQERLLPAMKKAEKLAGRCAILLAAAHELEIPLTISEQYPRGLGASVAQISDAGKEGIILEKLSFSCSRDENIRRRLDDLQKDGRDQLVIGGIEAHVCVLQSTLDLIDAGYRVFVVADAISSRKSASRKLAIARMREAGAIIINTEMAVFEWLERAGTAEFKVLSKLIK